MKTTTCHTFISFLRILPSYVPLTARPALFLTGGGTRALVLSRVFPYAHSVFPLLWHRQRMTRLFLRETPSYPF